VVGARRRQYRTATLGKYNLATIELYCLGNAIRTFVGKDDKFVNDKIALVKTNDPKNCSGAFFELIALNAFAQFYNVAPARENQPGYDGTIELGNGKSIRLSIKNYSISKHQEAFIAGCEVTKKIVEQSLYQYNSPPLEVFINKKTKYPSSNDDWKQLQSNIHGAFIEYNGRGKNFMTAQTGDWGIVIQQLIAEKPAYSQSKKSYTLIMTSFFHKNEEKNLFDKLEEACANLAEHEKTETADVKNFVIIHLPQIASRRNCEQWASDYFALYPDKPISCVILLQPLVVKNEKTQRNYISVGVSFVTREQLFHDFGNVLPINMAYPVGRLETEFTKQVIYMRETDSNASKINLINCYVYQHGHHYYDAVRKPDGSMEGELNKIASGIFKHSIFRMGSEAIELSGQFEPEDKLEIM